MGDELDDLLDEVEDQFFKQPSKKKLPHTTHDAEDTTKLERLISDDLDDIINDICCDDVITHTQARVQQKAAETHYAKSATKRCFPVLIGGSRFAMGHSDSSTQRNNVPDRDKLKKYLVRKKGQRAYACQCSWFHVSAAVDVSTLHDLKWICGKH